MSISSKVFSTILLGVALCHFDAAQATLVNYVPTATTYFGPVSSQITSTPYLRYGYQDWSWKQVAYSGVFTSAVLTIGAHDVDFGAGEIDNIYAYDANSADGVWVLLGRLSGADAAFSSTRWTLGSNFFDDIKSGLMLKIDIDASSAGWGVSLTSSQLSLVNANLIPEPGSIALVGLGLAGLIAVRKRKLA